MQCIQHIRDVKREISTLVDNRNEMEVIWTDLARLNGTFLFFYFFTILVLGKIFKATKNYFWENRVHSSTTRTKFNTAVRAPHSSVLSFDTENHRRTMTRSNDDEELCLVISFLRILLLISIHFSFFTRSRHSLCACSTTQTIYCHQ